MITVREWSHRRAAQSSLRRLEIQRQELAGQKLYLDLTEGILAGGPEAQIEKFGFADRCRQRNPERGELEGAMWRLGFNTFQDGVEMTLHIQNRGTTPWPATFTLETSLSVRSPLDPEDVTAGSFADLDKPERTMLHTGSSFFTLRDQHRHFWHQQHVEEFLASPDGVETFGPAECRPAVPSLGAGAIFRVSTDRKWVLAYGWNRTACVSCFTDHDALNVGAQLGELDIGQTREIKGLILLYRGTPDDALVRFRRHVGAKGVYDARSRRQFALHSILKKQTVEIT